MLTAVRLLLIRLVLAVGHTITGQGVVNAVSISTLKLINVVTCSVQSWERNKDSQVPYKPWKYFIANKYSNIFKAWSLPHPITNYGWQFFIFYFKKYQYVVSACLKPGEQRTLTHIFVLPMHVLSSKSFLSPRQLQLTLPSEVRRHRSWHPPLLTRQRENSPTKRQGTLGKVSHKNLYIQYQYAWVSLISLHIHPQTHKQTHVHPHLLPDISAGGIIQSDSV